MHPHGCILSGRSGAAFPFRPSLVEHLATSLFAKDAKEGPGTRRGAVF